MSNPPPSNRLPILILLFTAVGVPSAAGLAFANQVVQRPGWAFTLALFYELIVLLLGLTFKVWQKLESKWVEQIADWIDTRLKAIISRYRKHYLQHLVYRHRDFDVKGLTTQGIYTLELKRVFVELGVLPQPPHQASPDPVGQAPDSLREGQHSIWDYLNSKQMTSSSLVVIGPPGSGKTTLMKHVTIILSSRNNYKQYLASPIRIPVLLFLRDYVDAIKENRNFQLTQAIRESIAKFGGPLAPQRWFERQLEKGGCLIMLDGLDEVPDLAVRKDMADWVERQIVANAKNRFIITSRPHGYRTNPLGHVTVLEVRPFTTTQIEQFVHNWYIANEIMSSQKDDPGVHMNARIGAEDLLQRLHNTPALTALAVNPLLLTMIANVHRYRSSLPGRRVELYAEICEVFLGKRHEARGIASVLTPGQKQRVLQPLAFTMMSNEQREISLNDILNIISEPLLRVSPQSSCIEFLSMVENTSGLLLERENGIYSFAHLTFQEYLAAVHVREQKLEGHLVQQVEKSWWRETILLYIAQADATSIIAACLTSERPSVAALMLAIECLQEAREMQPEMRAILEEILIQGVEDVDSERRQLIARALLALRLRQMVPLGEDQFISNSLVTHAEYQVFLDEMQIRKKYYQPDHWPNPYFPANEGQNPISGLRPSDAIEFCKWLTGREPSEWEYRLPIVGESNKSIIDNQGLVHLSKSIGYWEAWNNGSRLEFEFVSIKQPVPPLIEIIIKRRLERDIRRISTAYNEFTDGRKLADRLKQEIPALQQFASVLSQANSLDLRYMKLSEYDNNMVLNLDHTIELAKSLPSKLEANNVRGLIRYLKRQDNVLRDLGNPEIINLAEDIAKACQFSLNRNNIYRNEPDWNKVLNLFRWYIRLGTLTLVTEILLPVSQKNNSRILAELLPNSNVSTSKQDGTYQLVNDCLGIFFDFVILEERIEKKLSSLEGIRILKQKKVGTSKKF